MPLMMLTSGLPFPVPALQVAMGVAQDVARQLPFTVLPTVVSGWVALIQGKNQPPPPQPHPGAPGHASTSGSCQGSDSSGGQAAGEAAAPPPPARPVNRARQLKMTEVMSGPAQDRWAALPPNEQQMMVQVSAFRIHVGS